jgi:excisionase family DNA binding protein
MEKFISVKQLCKILGCSIATIYRWDKEGVLPFRKVKIGKAKVGYRYSEVEDFISEISKATEDINSRQL